MPAHEHLSTDRARELVEQILNLSPERTGKPSLPLQGSLSFDQHAATVKPNEWMDTSTPAQYRLRVSYTDRGGDVIGPLTSDTEILFSHPHVRAALFDDTASTMTIMAPESSLIPEDLVGVPLVIATTPGGFVSFENIDLHGVDRVDIVATALSAFMEGGRIEVRQGAVDGPLIDTVAVESRLIPGKENFSANLEKLDGMTDLFFVFQTLDPEEESSGALLVLLSVNFVSGDKTTGKKR